MKIKCPKCKKKIEISKGNLVCKYCSYKVTKSDYLDILAERDGDGYSKKNVDIAGFLCLCFGPLGIHRFYLENYISGGIMLALTLSIFAVGQIGFVVPFYCYLLLLLMWGVDIVMARFNCFSDGDGKPLNPDPEPLSSSTHLTLGLVFLGAVAVFLVLSILPLNLSFYLNAIICFIVSIIEFVKSFLRKKEEALDD